MSWQTGMSKGRLILVSMYLIHCAGERILIHSKLRVMTMVLSPIFSVGRGSSKSICILKYFEINEISFSLLYI